MKHASHLLMLFVLLLPMGLQASEHEPLTFDRFFEQHSHPMWMIDIESGEIVRANPAAERFYGYDNLAGMDVGQINMLTPEQIKQEIDLAAAAKRNHLFFRHRLANGDVKLMGVYTNRFEWRGREVLVSSLYDTSDFESAAERHYVKRVEEQVDLQTAQLQAAKDRQFWIALLAGIAQAVVITVLVVVLIRLKRSYRENHKLVGELSFRNRELERLSHVMAHHFQEPSRRLVSFSQQVSKQAEQSENPGLKTAAGFIRDQAGRLSDLVGDVQRYLSLDQIKPEMERIDSGKVLDKAYLRDVSLGDMRNEACLSIPDILPGVYYDARRLEMIFRALLHNAWMYRHPDRPLKVQVSAEKVDERVVFCVADNGTGISPEYREQVLELFSRLVPSKNKVPGTGMGLALIVKALRPVDGRLRVEDGIEGGTAVYFDLPASR